MTRTARIAPKEYIYHILARGNNRQDVFKDEKDYRKYIEILQIYKGISESETYRNSWNDQVQTFIIHLSFIIISLRNRGTSG